MIWDATPWPRVGVSFGEGWDLSQVEGGHDVIVLVGSCVVGTWLSDLLSETSRQCEPPFEFHIGDAANVPPHLGAPRETGRTILVIGPGRAVMDAIAAQSVRVLAVIDDPADSVRFMRETADWDFIHALREQTRYASAHALLLENPVARIAQRGWRVSARTAVDRILTHLRYPLPQTSREALVESFGGPREAAWSFEAALAHRARGYRNLDSPMSTNSDREAEVVRDVLSPLLQSALTPDFGPIVWSREVFLFGDDRTAAAPRVVDATGGARIIFFGPYFFIPGGEYTLRMIVAFSHEIRGTRFMFSVLCQSKPVVRAAFKPTESGVFEVNLDLRHETPEFHIEVQFANEEGIIEGHIALTKIELRRTDP